MDLSVFHDRVTALSVGKKVAETVYMHVDALKKIDPDLCDWLCSFATTSDGKVPWNVAKLDSISAAASLLYYPTFRREAHPALDSSLTIDLASGRCRFRSYQDSSNPPVLHRKETLLSEDDPDFEVFQELTLAEVKAGLLEQSHTIGHREGWEQALKERGFLVDGHTLVAVSAQEALRSEVEVMRHRTAITRHQFSRPVQLLIFHGLLVPGNTFLDYGCGQGDDVRFLHESGYTASGWDPVFFPDEPTSDSDVVNLGYVLNVIEDLAERRVTLQHAFALARTVLCVSVLVGQAAYEDRARPFSDGVLTSKGTFQKYYQQEELTRFVEDCTKVTPIPVSAGIVLVFKETSAQHLFLLRRVQRRGVPTARVLPFRSTPTIRRALFDAFVEKHTDSWTHYGSFVREHGRPPFPEESDVPAVAQKFGIPRTELFEAARQEAGALLIEKAANRCRNEIIVFLAISRFRRLPHLSDLPTSVQHDIRFHFGSYRNALGVSETRLFATGDRGVVSALCSQAETGVQNSTGYFVSAIRLEELDPVLQIYARLGELFAGDLSSVDLVKIHTTSPKLSLFEFDDYKNKEEPILKTRIKIDLQSQQVRFFDHCSTKDPEVLVARGLLEGRLEAQERLGRRLLEANLPFGLIVRKSTIKLYSE